MRRPTRFQVHKWIAVSSGVLLLVWLVSGLVLIAPPLLSRPAKAAAPPPPIDLGEPLLSPHEAVAALARAAGGVPPVRAVTLKRIGPAVVYEIVGVGGDWWLLDARSGQRFAITAEVAEQLVRQRVRSQARVVRHEHVVRHSLDYPWGPLPAYRIVLADRRARAYYVSARDGEVQESDRWTRLQAAIGSLHTLEPAKLLGVGDELRTALLVVGGLLAVAAVGTGYFLALWRRRS